MAAANNSPKIVVSYRRADFRHVWAHLRPPGRALRPEQPLHRHRQHSFRRRLSQTYRRRADLERPPRRRDRPRLVRVEIETAMRSSVPILPVLIDGAMMPDPEQLPDSIKEFCVPQRARRSNPGATSRSISSACSARWRSSSAASSPGGRGSATRTRPELLLAKRRRRSKGASARLLPIILGSLLRRGAARRRRSGSGCGSGPLREQRPSVPAAPDVLQRALSRHRRGAHAIRPAFSARNPPAYGPRAFRRRAGRTARSAIGLMKARRPAITHARFRPTRRSMRSMHASMSSASM